MTYEDLKNEDFELYTLASHYRQKESGGTDDSIELNAERHSGGFSFSRTNEGSGFWATLYANGSEYIKATDNRNYLNAKTRALVLLVTKQNDKAMWEYILKSCKEISENF